MKRIILSLLVMLPVSLSAMQDRTCGYANQAFMCAQRLADAKAKVSSWGWKMAGLVGSSCGVAAALLGRTCTKSNTRWLSVAAFAGCTAGALAKLFVHYRSSKEVKNESNNAFRIASGWGYSGEKIVFAGNSFKDKNAAREYDAIAKYAEATKRQGMFAVQ